MKVEDFVGKYRKGSIMKEMPRGSNNLTIIEFLDSIQDKKTLQKVIKLLTDGRFSKKA